MQAINEWFDNQDCLKEAEMAFMQEWTKQQQNNALLHQPQQFLMHTGTNQATMNTQDNSHLLGTIPL